MPPLHKEKVPDVNSSICSRVESFSAFNFAAYLEIVGLKPYEIEHRPC